MSFNFNKFFVTFCYSGLSPLTPGTVGSFFTAVSCYSLLKYVDKGFAICVLLLILSCIFGWTETRKYLVITGRTDPKEVVIDEFAGQMLTILSCYLLIPSQGQYFLEKITILSFLFFRFFDITKVFPVSYFDNMDNAFGVMMDDVVAGIMAFLTVFLVYKFCPTHLI